MDKLIAFQRTWIKVALIILLVGALAYFASSIFGGVFVPREFLEARIKAADFAGRIVEVSEESVKNLSAISEANRGRNYGDGIDLVLAEIARNEFVRKSALGLSEELGKMAGSISRIRPKEASDVGFQATIDGSKMVQRLINYNSYIYELLDLFRGRFSAGVSVSDESVGSLITKMNGEISAINELNDSYNKLILEFDSLTKEED